jgi:hypothetical protein
MERIDQLEEISMLIIKLRIPDDVLVAPFDKTHYCLPKKQDRVARPWQCRLKLIEFTWLIRAKLSLLRNCLHPCLKTCAWVWRL